MLLSLQQAVWSEAICGAHDVASLVAALAVPREALDREVVELNDFMRPLNVIDSALEAVLRSHQGLILLWDKEGPPRDRAVPADCTALCATIVQVDL